MVESECVTVSHCVFSGKFKDPNEHQDIFLMFGLDILGFLLVIFALRDLTLFDPAVAYLILLFYIIVLHKTTEMSR